MCRAGEVNPLRRDGEATQRSSARQPTISMITMPHRAAGASGEPGDVMSRWGIQILHNLPSVGAGVATRAVVVVHGSNRNAFGYFKTMRRAAARAGQAADTLVVAPWFKTLEDQPTRDEAVWSYGRWKRGGGAARPTGLSTFAALDQLLMWLGDRSRFPDLRRVTIAGHSAGGQFTQRYAVFGSAPDRLSGVTVNYVVANPSSFLYFSPVRPSGDGRFTVPPAGCRRFDHYKYGMTRRSGYVAGIPVDQALRTYVSRDVTLLSGAGDIVDNGNEDRSCAALLQGPNRAARAANYLAYIQTIAPAAPHRRIVIPDVAHNGRAMFGSHLAWPALFGSRTIVEPAGPDRDASASVPA